VRVADRLLPMGVRPARIAGEWQLTERLGPAPRRDRTPQTLAVRDEVLRELGRHRRPTPAAGTDRVDPARPAANELDLNAVLLPETS
jgi:hypothetical protein